MLSKCVVRTVIGILGAAIVLSAQAPPTVAVRAGRLFDPKTGQMVTDQVVLIQGQRITAVGSAASVSILAGGKVTDLSRASVLPGLTVGQFLLTDGGSWQQRHNIVAMVTATDAI